MKSIICLVSLLLVVVSSWGQVPKEEINQINLNCNGESCKGKILGIVDDVVYIFAIQGGKEVIFQATLDGKKIKETSFSSLTEGDDWLRPSEIVFIGNKHHLLLTNSPVKNDYTFYAVEILSNGFGPLKKIYNFVDYTKVGAWVKKFPVLYLVPRFASWQHRDANLSLSPSKKYLLLSGITINDDIDKVHLVVFDENLQVVSSHQHISKGKKQFFLTDAKVDDNGKIAFCLRVFDRKMDTPKMVIESTFEMHLISASEHITGEINFPDPAYYLQGKVAFTPRGIAYVGTATKINDYIENASGIFVATMDEKGTVLVKNTWFEESFLRKLNPGLDPKKSFDASSLFPEYIQVTSDGGIDVVLKQEKSFSNAGIISRTSHGYIYVKIDKNAQVVLTTIIDKPWYSPYYDRQTLVTNTDDGTLAILVARTEENSNAKNKFAAEVEYIMPDGSYKSSSIALPEDVKIVFPMQCHLHNGEFIFISATNSEGYLIRIKP